MKNFQQLFLVHALHDSMQKTAAAGGKFLAGGLRNFLSDIEANSGVRATAADLFNRGRSAVSGAANRGFENVGRSVYGMPSSGVQGGLRKLLLGNGGDMSNVISSAYQSPETSDLAGKMYGGIGRQVSKRVGAGAGLGVGGVLGAEAPFKYENNRQYEQQQAHPIRSWVAQHFAGAPKLRHQSYLSPF